MKSVSKLFVFVGISFLLPSCFLFKGSKGAHCPAYGMEMKDTKTTTLWAATMVNTTTSGKASQ
jgi:hypothetical protein